MSLFSLYILVEWGPAAKLYREKHHHALFTVRGNRFLALALSRSMRTRRGLAELLPALLVGNDGSIANDGDLLAVGALRGVVQAWAGKPSFQVVPKSRSYSFEERKQFRAQRWSGGIFFVGGFADQENLDQESRPLLGGGHVPRPRTFRQASTSVQDS